MVVRTWKKKHASASVQFSSGVTRCMVKNIAQRWHINCFQRAFSSRVYSGQFNDANAQFRNCAFY